MEHTKELPDDDDIGFVETTDVEVEALIVGTFCAKQDVKKAASTKRRTGIFTFIIVESTRIYCFLQINDCRGFGFERPNFHITTHLLACRKSAIWMCFRILLGWREGDIFLRCSYLDIITTSSTVDNSYSLNLRYYVTYRQSGYPDLLPRGWIPGRIISLDVLLQ